MNSRIHGQNGHSNHHADEVAQDGHAGAEYAGLAQEARTFMRGKVQHTKMQRARMQHNKMLAAAFYRNKSFMARDKLPSPSMQKLLARFGQRPRAESYAKGHGKEELANVRHENAAHAQEPKHEHVHEQKQEQEKQGQGQEHKREHDHEHEQQKQGQGREHKHEQQKQEQGQEHKREHSQDQKQGQDRGQSPQQGPRDGQQRREDRDGREKPSRKYAVKVSKVKALRRQAFASPMQLIAKDNVGSPDLPGALTAAATKAALHLMSQIEHDGPLLAVPFLLSMASPLRMVEKRLSARLHSHYNAALALGPAASGKSAATAGLIGLSLDNALARQGSDIDYSDDDQSIAMIRQRILDALGGMPAGAATSAPLASDKTLEVRMAPAAPAAKT